MNGWMPRLRRQPARHRAAQRAAAEGSGDGQPGPASPTRWSKSKRRSRREPGRYPRRGRCRRPGSTIVMPQARMPATEVWRRASRCVPALRNAPLALNTKPRIEHQQQCQRRPGGRRSLQFFNHATRSPPIAASSTRSAVASGRLEPGRHPAAMEHDNPVTQGQQFR